MFKKTDPNTFTKFCTLLRGTETIGSIYLEYEVTLYEDVQSNGAAFVDKPKVQKFILNCTQRINIYNPASMSLQPSVNLTKYVDYPVMINTSMSLSDQPTGTYFLLDYSPQTINTQIESSGTTGTETGKTTGSSTSNTSGSSVSQTNSFGTTVTVGDSFSGASATVEHSSTVSREKSSTTGTDVSNNNSANAAKSASMSIKDWGAYAMINPNTNVATWTFGQEYPWDAIICKNATGSTMTDPKDLNNQQAQLYIPTYMLVQMYDGVTLFPPSELSMFGINFVMKASLLVGVADGASDEVTVEHIVNYFAASHLLADGKVTVYIDQSPHVLQVPTKESLSTTINLNFMALSPLGQFSSTAVIGFIPNKFITRPVPATADPAASATPFKIISATNDLMIQDTTNPVPSGTNAGFSASPTSLTANFSDNCTSLQMTIYFKVIDSVANYMLYMKHWKAKATGVMLTIVINNTENTIIKYVDALEAEGGENNLLAIALRNQDFTSVDYHDYLQLGLNSIQITITPIDTNYADCIYQLRAISIENA